MPYDRSYDLLNIIIIAVEFLKALESISLGLSHLERASVPQTVKF
jgi:hypothetical protein